MKKMLWMGFLFLSLVATCILPVATARDRNRNFDGGQQFESDSWADRARARQILRRTAEVLQRAQRAAEQGGQYQGLSKALAHQKRGRRLFRAEFYPEAVFHSKRSRKIAFDVLQNNRAMTRDDWRAMRSNDEDRDFDFDVWISKDLDDDKAALRFSIEFD